MAKKLIEVIERYGLVAPQEIDRQVSALPFRQISSIIEEIDEALRPDLESQPDDDNSLGRFNFLASASSWRHRLQM